MLQKSPKMILNPLQTPEISTINIIPDLMMWKIERWTNAGICG
jgi:hypothetical protein